MATLDRDGPGAAEERPGDGVSKESTPRQVVNRSRHFASEDQCIHDGVWVVGRENRRAVGGDVALPTLLNVQEEETDPVTKRSSEG